MQWSHILLCFKCQQKYACFIFLVILAAIYRVVLVVETTVYQSSDITTLNNPSSDEFKDVKTGVSEL